MVDTGVYVVAHQLIVALAAELANTRAGAPCVATVHGGISVPMEACVPCRDQDTGETWEGMAWTRVASIGPTIRFPQLQSQPIPSGQVVQLAAMIELGVDRCYPTTDSNEMPEIARLDSAARDVIDDAAAMLRAIRCTDLAGDVVIGPWAPRGPQGGVHGGTMTVTVQIDTCGCGSSMPPLDTLVPMMIDDPRTPGQ